jgi:hypothetical protein
MTGESSYSKGAVMLGAFTEVCASSLVKPVAKQVGHSHEHVRKPE